MIAWLRLLGPAALVAVVAIVIGSVAVPGAEAVPPSSATGGPTYDYDSPSASTTHRFNARTDVPSAQRTPTTKPRSSTSRIRLSRATKAADEGTEIVHRAMSRAELEATRKTGLVRGGRSGPHYVTDSANSNALRARQRLALPQTPELIVGLRVPGGVFGPPTRVGPNFGMPGGGLERRGVGRIPCQIAEVRSC